MEIGFDFAWKPWPSVSALKAAGATFVARYLCWESSGTKVISRAEMDSYTSNGLKVLFVWEYDAGAMKGGYATGKIHAQEAVRQAKALGLGPGTCIYYACDWDATPGQQTAINEYLRACREVHAGYYRVGIYGGYWPVKRALDAGAVDCAWQTYAWSGGNWDSRAAVRQVKNGITVGGADCDRNELHGNAYMWDGTAVDAISIGDEMTEQEHIWLENLYNGMFKGGDSCGSPVDDTLKLKDSVVGNAVFDQLNELRQKENVGGVDVRALAEALGPALETLVRKVVSEELGKLDITLSA